MGGTGWLRVTNPGWHWLRIIVTLVVASLVGALVIGPEALEHASRTTEWAGVIAI
jgi:hypothetical protein